LVDNVGNNFALHAKDRTYNFIVDSLPDKVSWMKALQQQIKQVRAPKRWSKTGFMKKRGGNWKTWKMRWFCLDDQQLYYFKKVLSSYPAGAIPLYASDIVARNDIGRENCFMIHRRMRTYYLVCESKEKVKEWVAALKEAQAVLYHREQHKEKNGGGKSRKRKGK